MPRLSLVIPAFNEERYLPRLLESVEVARAAYTRGRDQVEVIVADNCSTDRTARVAEARGCRVVRVERRAIGAARNGGARVATGDILCFVDADSRIHRHTFDAIEATVTSARAVGGATGVTLERISPGIAVTFGVMVPFVWLTGLDTGVVFCRREDFEAVGGYDERRLFAEDVVFLLALRRLGKARGQRLARVTTAKAVLSTRKFDQYGDWHYFAAMPALGWAALRSRSVPEFARRYWYEAR